MPGIAGIWRMLQLHTDQIRNLQMKQQAIAPGGTVIVNGGSAVLLSDETPQPVGLVGDPGVGMAASRDDHVHEAPAPPVIGQYRQFVYTSDNPFTFVVDGDGQPVFALLDLE